MADENSESSVKLATKLVQLGRATEKTATVLSTGKESAIKRHVETLRDILKDVSKLVRTVEAEKITAKQNNDEIDTWVEGMESKINNGDEKINLLEEWLNEARERREFNDQKKKMDLEMELYEAKIKLQAEHLKPDPKESTPSEISVAQLQAKLPKMTISIFDGSYGDWPRFWGQFSETINKTSIQPVTKFTYLRELLCDKAKRAIEALPFTAEGYNRAISILQDRFGKESEIVKTYVKEILELPYTASSDPKRIHDFYEKLSYCVQSLETMKQLDAVNGTVTMTLDKLPNIRGDLVRNDVNWDKWNYLQLTEALQLWTRRNPVEAQKPDDRKKKKEWKHSGYHFSTQQKPYQISKSSRKCVYCSSEGHRSAECDTILTFEDRKKFLAAKHLCFNCTGPSHRASECKSTSKCRLCNKQHHTSICDAPKVDEHDTVKTAHTEGDNEVIYPIVMVQIDGIKTHALLDTGAGSSYASSSLTNALKRKPKAVKTKQIEMMLGSTTTRVEIYAANLKSLDQKFELEIEVSKVDKPELMKLNNPNYAHLLEKFKHLNGAKFEDPDTRSRIPIHLVLGVSDYAKIKTTAALKVGLPGEPVAEKTLLGWTVMSPGKEREGPILLTQSTTLDYEQLCSLDVLGLADRHENDQKMVFSEFEEQLKRDQAGWYETTLPWKGNHAPLPTHENGSKRRLEQLVRKLKRNGQYSEYNEIIQDQLEQGIIERAPATQPEKAFYIPHKAVVRKQAETTKLRVVYDASAKESETQPSLNDCLHPGPPLQNLLWDVLVRSRFHPILLTGDLKQAFLQVRIQAQDRDSLRFHWIEPNGDVIQVYRFTRALFGLTCSPFLLGGVLKNHLDAWEKRYPEIVKQIREGLYVDDLITGGSTVPQTQLVKEKAVEVFADAVFTIHKWHSNSSELEPDGESQAESSDLTYAKDQLGGNEQPDGKVLGVPWNRKQDTISVTLTPDPTFEPATKRTVLSKLARIYDPLGLASPVTLAGKLLYRSACDNKIPWDANLSKPLQTKWEKWNETLENYTIPRPLAPHHQPIQELTIHGFGDASGNGVCAVVYAVVKQEDGVTQGLVCSKSRIAKRNLTIPRLELISGHMTVNLATNVQQALAYNQTTIHCWLDSTVALYWIKDRGEYRQFVANRIHKIRQHENVVWHYVPTGENPADVGSRGGKINNSELWKDGPPWLSDPTQWPIQENLEATPDSQAEAKIVKEIFKAAIVKESRLDSLLEKYSLPKVLRISAWARRFTENCRKQPAERRIGPINSREVQEQREWWIRQAQEAVKDDRRFHADQEQLNLQENDLEILECRGRIIGEYPVYIPDIHPFAASLVREAHRTTLHGGVGLTMAKIRERYWIPRLRRLVKKVRSSCNGCKRFRAKAYEAPPPGNLPTTRTQGTTPFEVVGVDFAGPIKYVTKTKKEAKAYLALYACSLTRAVHLDVVRSLDTKEFIMSLKRFIARRGRPKLIYSDNAKTFKAAEKWILLVRQDENLNSLLANMSIEWRFNLSRAPWWGGQFERLIGLFKSSFYKSIGNGVLTWSELEEVVLDIEIAMNNRPLCYLEDDVQMPVLTPNSMLHIQPTNLPELQRHHIDGKDLRKRARFLSKCKQAMWNRWTREYVRGLREQHRMTRPKSKQHPKIGEVVIVKDEQRPRNMWKLAIVKQLIRGRDGVIRAAKLKTAGGNNYLERAIQHLYSLELECEKEITTVLDPEAEEFAPRPKRNAAAAARLRITDIAEDESV